MSDLKPFLAKVADGKTLTLEESAAAFECMMSGAATPAQIGAFLMALRVRGETVDEITGGVQVMRSKAVQVEAPEGAIDTCGTGGDASGTYNISTAATFVVAGCGVKIAKHGNKAQSSKSGSADILQALGVKLDIDAPLITRCINEAGVGFMMAPFHHAAMKHVGPVRAELGTRTLFNLMGPLSNPAGTKRQLIGVYSAQWLVPMAEVLKKLGAEKVWLVHGSDGLDEITTTGPSQVVALDNGTIREFTITPQDVGLALAKPADLKGGDVEQNAKALRALLGGAPGAYRDIVVINAAAALMVADQAKGLKEGVALASSAIDEGKAKQALEALVTLSNS